MGFRSTHGIPNPPCGISAKDYGIRSITHCHRTFTRIPHCVVSLHCKEFKDEAIHNLAH
ncbi:hypothetical protein [Helicobacter sp. MIT 05-5294]|uniref:hypothetical protein n=1 Tax=Helicobacter sp. MIT 05-5294 TaxID=1548150 RepID=UPI000AE827F1|nr:hypothetical protein [Helicobacter sp. MIT 05-5294]